MIKRWWLNRSRRAQLERPTITPALIERWEPFISFSPSADQPGFILIRVTGPKDNVGVIEIGEGDAQTIVALLEDAADQARRALRRHAEST